MSIPRTPQPRGGRASADDIFVFNLVVVLIGTCAGSYWLWTRHHAEISAAVLTIESWQNSVAQQLARWRDVPDITHPADVTLNDLYAVLHAVGDVFRVPAVILILGMAVVCGLGATPARYRRKFDIDGLAREQSVTFTTSAAFAGRHLKLVRPDTTSPRPADYVLRPDEWIGAFARRNGRFNEAAAWRALVQQLGPRWFGPEKASDPARFLFAVFALQLAEQRDGALTLLGEASIQLHNQGEDRPEGPEAPLSFPAQALAEAECVIRNPAVTGPASEIAARHAYTHTALMTLLTAARTRAGVLAPAQFAWLKLIDRHMWYALHSLGFEADDGARYLHPNPFIEAIGARDHWAVERLLGSPVVEPSVERALDVIRCFAGQQREGVQAPGSDTAPAPDAVRNSAEQSDPASRS